jgi:hypothetical protein
MLHTNSPHQKRKRGRPRKPRRRKFADTVREYCERTGDSRSTAFRKMKEGVLRFIQEAPGYPRKIRTVNTCGSVTASLQMKLQRQVVPTSRASRGPECFLHRGNPPNAYQELS